MAEKMKEKYQKSMDSAKQQSVTNINRAGRPVPLNIYTSNNQASKDNNDNPPKDYPSECGIFGWEEIGTCHVPYIYRKINGENIRYVAVRIAETLLLQKYLKCLHKDIYSCTCVGSHFVSKLEAEILNEINTSHSELLYGKDPFCVGKDIIVLLDDVKELYAFLETCYKKLLRNITPEEKCGFIYISSESIAVPYCIIDNHKYLPLFYFECEMENLRHRAIELKNWHLAYLKFCCKVQDIRNELYASDSCTVTRLDDVKNAFPPDTVFEEYWPANAVDTQLLINPETATLNTSGSWIRIPNSSENPYGAVAAAAAAQTSTLPPPLSMPLGITTTSNHQMNPTLMQQSNTPINNGVGHATPPPLFQASLQSAPISDSGSSSNGSINHTTMHNPVSSNVSYSNQGRPIDNDNPPKDYPSECGIFGWEEIGTCHVPYIYRKINGENIRYVAVRIAETLLLQKYLKCLHKDIYSCTCVGSHFVSKLEAEILNEINTSHSELLYGKDPFCVGKDIIVLLDDVKELYAFLETCYKKLLRNITPEEKCGFIYISSESIAVPYCIIDNHKYLPLFYFECEMENLRHRAIELKNWHLAYLKFCCKVQGIRNELYASDSCTVTRLDDVKNAFPPDTVFEEYWPANAVDTQLLTNPETATLNTSGSWIRIPNSSENPYGAVAAAAAQTSTLPPPLSMPLGITTTSNHQMNPTLMQQSNTPINNGVGHATPPPLFQASLQSAPISDSGSSSNGSINHTTMHNPVSSNVSYSNQGRPIINQLQKLYETQPLHGGSATTRMTNTQRRNVLRNITTIDLTSPPPSPPPQHDSSRTSNTPWTLKRKPENSPQWPQPSNATAYKIQKANLEGNVFYCINSRPFVYSDLILTLDELVQSVFPTSNVATIAQFLQKYLKTTLYRGNSEQMAVLRENGRFRSLSPDTPFAMLQDVKRVFLRLKSLIANQDEQVQPYQTNGPSKRQRTS